MKKHSLILINHYKRFCYLGLLLTLPSLLITTTTSVNSASAADDIVTENQPGELITDKVVTAAQLEPKVESISEQQQPQLIAQTADSDPDDINKIRQELLVEPLIKFKIVAPNTVNDEFILTLLLFIIILLVLLTLQTKAPLPTAFKFKFPVFNLQ